MAANTVPDYDLIVFGATGFTGKLCAEYITQHLPTDLRWAVAGRNHQKLAAVVEDLKKINSDRTPPGIEVVQLSSQELDKLVRKTRLIITSVGPFALYGTPVVEACAKAGTHYIDCTGETPWVYDIVKEYHETAKQNGAVLIPLCGMESAPADIAAYVLATYIRKNIGSGVSDMIHSIQSFAGSTSGGTLLSAINIFDTFSLLHLKTSSGPFALASSRPQGTSGLKPLSYKLFGSHYFSGLGLLTDSLCGGQDRQIVYRTWSLMDGGKTYGPKLNYSSWMRAKGRLGGFAFHYGMAAALAALLFKPLRMLLKRVVTQPGEGPSKDRHAKHFVTFKSFATSDSDPSKKAVCTMSFRGDMYYMTGMLMAEAAMVLLRPDAGKENWAQRLRGGVLTPATLGDQYVERLHNAGLKIEVASAGDMAGTATRARL